MTSRVVALWRKRARGGPMDALDEVTLVTGHGIRGNANVGGKRQVTIISRERWDRVEADLGRTVDPALRRANVLVSGVALHDSRGRTLQLGACRVLVHGEAKPCDILEDGYAGLRDALAPDWGGGVYGEVTAGGSLHVGDRVAWVEDPDPIEETPHDD